MKVLVTGGTGSVGRAAVARLVCGGHAVRVIGRRSGIEIDGAEYVVCDITDFDALRRAVRGCDGVVHLAAVAAPSGAPAQELFQINVSGTFNVFEAAAAEGIRRVVQASSINAFGCFFSLVDMKVEYFPIDEAHPTFTTDPYSFSKTVIEEIGAYYWRRDGISSVALRLPWVHPAEHGTTEDFRQRVGETRALLDEFAAQPPGDRRRRIDEIAQRAVEYRQLRPFEHGRRDEATEAAAKPLREDPLSRIYLHDRFNFWTFVDERDSAQAIEKALTTDYDGSEVLFINDDRNWLRYDAETLVNLFFPDVAGRKRPLTGPESLVSIDRAAALIDFQPAHSATDFLADPS